MRLELAVHAEDLLRRGEDRLLERLQEDLDVDPLVLAHLLEHHRQIRLHMPSFTLELVNQIGFFHVVDGHFAYLVTNVDLHLAGLDRHQPTGEVTATFAPDAGQADGAVPIRRGARSALSSFSATPVTALANPSRTSQAIFEAASS